MKKDIIIALLAITTIISVVYAFYQKGEANAQEALVVENGKIVREMSIKAEQAMRMAEEQRHIAEANAMQAMRQVQLAHEALKKKK